MLMILGLRAKLESPSGPCLYITSLSFCGLGTEIQYFHYIFDILFLK
jgi:hypothetical protein